MDESIGDLETVKEGKLRSSGILFFCLFVCTTFGSFVKRRWRGMNRIVGKGRIWRVIAPESIGGVVWRGLSTVDAAGDGHEEGSEDMVGESKDVVSENKVPAAVDVAPVVVPRPKTDTLGKVLSGEIRSMRLAGTHKEERVITSPQGPLIGGLGVE